LVELQIVVLAVAGSSPVGHPIFFHPATGSGRATYTLQLHRPGV
jgi:hypothetical protein